MGLVFSCCIQTDSEPGTYYEFEENPANIAISSEESCSDQSLDEWVVVDVQTES